MHSTSPSNQALQDAIDKVGGQSAMARILSVSQAAVWKWVAKGKLLPAEHVLVIERETGIAKEILRPDIYPDESDRPAHRLDKGAPDLGALEPVT